MQIECYVKNVYGNDLIYIADPEVRKNISILTGRSTVTNYMLQALERLGHTIKEVTPPKK